MKLISTFLFCSIMSLSLIAQAPNDGDCGGALSICNLVFSEPTPGNGEGNFPGEIDVNATCVSGESNAAWYTFTANSDGFLNFLITPDDANDDYDWVLFDITSSDCSDIFEHPELAVSCNAAGGVGCHGPTGPNGGSAYSDQGGGCGNDPPNQGAGLSAFNDVVPMLAGNNYALMVSNWTGSNAGYTIDFSNSTGLGTQDVTPPTVQSVEPPTDCSSTGIIVTFSENIQCSSISAANFQITGTGGPYSVILSSPSCDQGGDHDRVFTITTNPPLVGVGNFTFDLFTNGSNVLDLCDNPAASWGTNFSTNYSFDFAPSVIPATLEICEEEDVTIAPQGNNGLALNNFNFYTDAGLNNLIHSGEFYNFPASISLSIWVTESTPFCESPATQYMLTVHPKPATPDAIDPVPVCQGNPITDLLGVGSGGTLHWYDQNPMVGNPTSIGTGSPFSPPNSTENLGSILFYLTEESAFGCVSDMDVIAVIVVEGPPAPGLDQSEEICIGGTAPTILVNEGGGAITWYEADPEFGDPAILGNGNPFMPPLDVNSAGPTDFFVTETDNNGCESEANYVTVTVQPIPTITDTIITCSNDVQSYSVSIMTIATDNIMVNIGDIQDNGGGNFVITNIPIATTLTITASTGGSSNCTATFVIDPPNCGCPNILPPISNGDLQICSGDTITAISVNVPPGMTVDWYDATTGGSLLLAGNTSFLPSLPGDYYAETSQIAGNCTSNTRTEVSITISPVPSITDTTATCSADLMTYSVFFDFANADTITAHNEGTVIDHGDGTFDITGIPSGTNLSISAAQTTTTCQSDFSIPAPDCSCPEVTAPTSLGDQVICEGASIPSLQASVGAGEIINWYDAATGGTLIQADSTAYIPTVAGTYYAETSVTLTGCISDERTPVSLTIHPLPTILDTTKNCSADLLTYSVIITLSSGDSLSSNLGTLTENTSTNYLINDIDVANNITVTIYDTVTNCETSFTVNAPSCICDDVNPPLNTGDFEMCAGDAFPEISVGFGAGQTIDWYDLPIGGNLIAEGMTTFTPDSLGTYYAETRLTENGCLSDTRTAVTLSENQLPALTSITPTCSIDLLNYSVILTFEETDTITISAGNLIINGGGSFEITDIPIADTLFITAINQTTLCDEDFTLSPPDCDCLAVQAPINDGDQTICNGAIIPTLSVTVNVGETVDWYDAILDGTLLLEDSNTFLPVEAGIFYAQTRVVLSDCVSSNRTGVELTINPLPTLLDTVWTCAEDLATYATIIFTNNADSIVVNTGTITDNNDGSFDITFIPINTALDITLINIASDCRTDYSFPLPNCECPDIQAPSHIADQEICLNGVFPILEVSTQAGNTIDWYDAAIGGTLLLADSPTFSPTAAGTYFAEARATISNCVSDTRVLVQMVVNDLPQLSVTSTTDPSCGIDDGIVNLTTNQGQMPYVYQVNGNDFQNSETFSGLPGTTDFSFIVEDINGCRDTLDTQLLSHMDPIAVISEGDTLTCSQTTFTVNAGMTTADGGVTFEWLHDGVFVSDFIQIDITDPGQYILLVHQDACLSVDTLDVILINEVDLDIIVSTDEELNCVVEAITLDGSLSSQGDNISYQWYLNNASIPGANQNTFAATEAGFYELELRESATGCTDKMGLPVIKNEDLPTANAGNDQTIDCNIDEVTLNGAGSTGTNAISYQWYGADNLPINGATDPNFTTETPGIYLLEVTDLTNLCKHTNEVLVGIDITDPIANAGDNMTLFCNETELSLDGSNSSSVNDLSYQWQTTTGQIISGGNSPTPLIGSTGMYTLLITDLVNGCQATASTMVNQLEEINTKVLVSTKDVGCSDEKDGFIFLSPENTNSTLLYSINNEALLSNGSFTGLGTGSYFIVAEDINGCQWDTTLIILSGLDLSLTLTAETEIRYGDSTQLTTVVSPAYDTTMTLTWTNSDLLACQSCLQTWTNPLFESTEFEVTITDKNGCSATQKLLIIVDATKQIFVPNAFSPNDDGVNDLLYIQSDDDVVNIKNFQIFNRWGESVFSASDFPTNVNTYGWDGKSRGQKAPPAVYVYSVEVEFIDGRKVIYSGEIVLIR